MRVLLIGWDAADWKVINPLMDAGKMPNLHRLVENGAMAQITTLHPPLSPMLWTSIATGKRPFKHGVHGFSEPSADGRGVQPVTNLSRKCKALWNILNQNGLRSIVTGWWPSHPAEPINGVMVSNHYQVARGPISGEKAQPWPMLPGVVHPAELAPTLAELRFHPDELTPPMVEPFIPLAKEIDQDKDKRLAGCMRTLCECVSIHSAATWLLQNQPWDFFAVYYDAIDHFCHGFMRYHPPRQDYIPQRDFELYHNVVSQAYQFHDQMLGTLLRTMDNDTRVILMSDHGFHPDHLRPRYIPDIPAGPAIEHRDLGILVISGPGIKKDELIHGANLLDITPTVLSMFDLPMGEDMDGKVLVGAFEEPPEVRTIPSWEDVAGEDGRHPPHTRLDAVAAKESLEQLIALGYIERPDENVEKAVAHTVQELRYNLGEAYQDAGMHGEAHAIFRELYDSDRDEQRFAVHLFVSCQALGRVEEMRSIVEDLDGRRRAVCTEALDHLREFAKRAEERAKERKEQSPQSEEATEKLFNDEERKELRHWRDKARFQPPVVDYLKAQILSSQRKWSEALACLERVTESHLTRPGLFLQAAELYIRMQRWEEAEKIYSKALEIDPDNPHAHIGMCRLSLHRRNYTAAAEAALESLQRLYWNPVGHFLLGMALTGMRDYERAAEAFRAALALNPNYRQAHFRLAHLLKRRLNDPEGAEEHLRIFRELRSVGKTEPARDFSPAVGAGSSARQRKAEATRSPDLPPLNDEVVVVSGLPRSGTSMLMQMLVAGGLPAVTDGLRQADEDNPRGYFEYEPVKHMRGDGSWLKDAKGKAVKIVAPLIPDVPLDTAMRVVFIERDLDEILASQGKMIARRGEQIADTPARRARLKDQYEKSVLRVKTFLANRPQTHLLSLDRTAVLKDPTQAADALNRFLGGGLDSARMAAEVEPSLNRQGASG
jgi:predicted AlkP superfamily phosphohydrolase/phosphomutase/tetratricopeptide (TPR) repeat protein